MLLLTLMLMLMLMMMLLLLLWRWFDGYWDKILFEVFNNNRSQLCRTSNGAESQFRCIKGDYSNNRNNTSIAFQKLIQFVDDRGTKLQFILHSFWNTYSTSTIAIALKNASAGVYASYRRQPINNNNNNNTNDNNTNTNTTNNSTETVRPPKSVKEIQTLRKLTPKQKRSNSRSATRSMQTIPFLNISSTPDAVYLLVATIAMNDIKQQQTFEHATNNNILNFAGSALDLWLHHNRSLTAKTIAQFEQLFKQHTPTYTTEPTTVNKINGNSVETYRSQTMWLSSPPIERFCGRQGNKHGIGVDRTWHRTTTHSQQHVDAW